MNHPATVADAAELLEFWTAILRGGQSRAELDADELSQVGLSNRCKAAEMLAKLLGLPDEAPAESPPVLVDDVPAQAGAPRDRDDGSARSPRKPRKRAPDEPGRPARPGSPAVPTASVTPAASAAPATPVPHVADATCAASATSTPYAAPATCTTSDPSAESAAPVALTEPPTSAVAIPRKEPPHAEA